MTDQPSVLILGIGNLLWADEGFGVRALEALRRDYRFAANVSVVDGGTQGIYLVEHIRAADILVVFDAVDYGLPGGTLKVVEGDEVPCFLGAKKVSLHQTGFQEVLALADMLGDYPSEILLVGAQPVELEDYGGSLRPAVRAQIDPAIQIVLAYLQARGIGHEYCPGSGQPDIRTAGAIADIAAYEAGRPPPEQACRVGDDRVLRDGMRTVVYRPVTLEGALHVDVDAHLRKYRQPELG